MEDRIPLARLKFAITELIDAYSRDSGETEIVVPDSQALYWHIAPEKMPVSGAQRPDLDVGNLIDDWEFIERMLTADYEPMPLMLIHIYPIIAYMAKEVIEKNIIPRAPRAET